MKLTVTMLLMVNMAIPPELHAFPKCEENRMFSAEEYWFWEGYLGVEILSEDEEFLEGRLRHDRSICFSVERAILEGSLEKTKGYKRAVEEWFNRIPIEPDNWIDEDAVDILQGRQRIEAITGIAFPSRSGWARWWNENQDYLLWSDEENRLVIVEKAKQARAPMVEDFEDIDAVEYWLLRARNWISELQEQDDYITGLAWIPPEGDRKVRIHKNLISNRDDKEKGYLLAVRQIILDGVALSGLTDEELDELVGQLQGLTGERFHGKQAWLDWWRLNENNLELSQNGTKLVLKQE